MPPWSWCLKSTWIKMEAELRLLLSSPKSFNPSALLGHLCAFHSFQLFFFDLPIDVSML